MGCVGLYIPTAYIPVYTAQSVYVLQIERFACLYTSHVSNLSYVSPDKKWQGRLDFMAHEDACLADLLM